MAVSAAKYFEVHWRVKNSGETWSPIQQTSPVSALSIEGLEPSKIYQVEVRAVSECGARSLWSAYEITTPDNTQRVSQSNINMLRVGGIGSAWTGFAISYVSTPTAATISCTAGTLQDGANNPSYAASSVSVSGTASTTVHYWLYYDDPAGAGGTVTLGATTTYSDLSANQGRINVGDLDVVFPASGSGGGSGSPGGGGCPVVEAWVYARRYGFARWMRAGKVRVGDWLWLPRLMRWGRVTYSQAKLAECVRIDTERGAPLSCSTTAPIGVCAGPDVLAPDLLGIALPSTIYRKRADDTCTAITPLGLRWVQHITCEHSHFLAGDLKGRGLDHHNLKPA